MGIKKNFGYNLILTFCNYLYPLITFPYVSHVLGVKNIGVCGFMDSVVEFFVLFSMLGIGSYGVREIARCGNDLERRNIVFTNLFTVNLLLTFLAVSALVICTYNVPALLPYTEFLYVGIVKIVFNLFLIEWFFQGIQQFKYITLRSVVVRTFYVAAVLLLVRDSGDTLIYYVLTTSVVVFNAFFNWFYSARFRKWSFKGLNLRAYFIPIIIFGYYRILTSMYTIFNTIFLRAVTDDTEVGYFTAATKLYSIFMAVFAAFTTTMIPRVSAMLAAKEFKSLQRIADDTFVMLFTLTLPVIFFSIFFAPQIMDLIAGQGFEGTILPFRIVIVLLVIIGMEQIVIQQFLMASPSNRPVLVVATVGAVVGVSLNFMLTSRLGAVGSAVSWALSEVAVLCIGVMFMKRNTSIYVAWDKLLSVLLWAIPYLLLDALLFMMLPATYAIYAAAILNIVLFVLINFKLNKNKLIADTFSEVFSKFKRQG